MGITGACVRRSHTSAPGPSRARLPRRVPHQRARSTSRFLKRMERAGPAGGGGPQAAGVAGRPANRRQVRNRGHQWAGASGSRGGWDSCRAREPDEAHLDSCAEELGSPSAGAQRQLSTSPTSSPSGHWLFIHFPKEAAKDPSVKLSPSNVRRGQIPSNT